MSKVDFYILQRDGEGPLLQFGCRLVEKAWQQGHRVYVRTEDEAASRRMDEALWTFRQDSFVPHARIEDDPAPGGSPVLVGARDVLPPGVDVLVNLGVTDAGCTLDCARIAELVPGDDGARGAARERFRRYRDAGAQIDTHDV